MPPTYTIRPATPADIPAIEAVQRAYSAAWPCASVIPSAVYLSPSFHDGADVFCAFEGERLVAYAPVTVLAADPGSAERAAWAEVKALPDLPGKPALKLDLLARVIARARELAEGSPTRLNFEYRPCEQDAIDFVCAQGFEHSNSAYTMQRDLSAPLPQVTPPAGLALRRWRMESEAEQREYVAAHNRCLPQNAISLESWQYYMQSPMWAVGSMASAFDRDRLVGCVSVYWIEEENGAATEEQAIGEQVGYTEDIFTLPEYRGQGIASALIVEGMRYLKEHGLQQARLTVLATNENALTLYRRLGYEVTSQSRFYSKFL